MCLAGKWEALSGPGAELGLQVVKKRLRGEKAKYFGYCCLVPAPNTMRQLEGHTFGVQEENGVAKEGIGGIRVCLET